MMRLQTAPIHVGVYLKKFLLLIAQENRRVPRIFFYLRFLKKVLWRQI
jgi:GTP-dependent phosphoenolpyruvate carboxykinase